MKSWARELAVGLLLATAIPPAVAFAAPSAEQILLDKVNYWRLKDRPDLAMEALRKLLAINPNNQDALYQHGLLSVQQNKPEEARQYLAKLRQVNPSNPHIADLENAIRAGQVSPNELGEARRLAQAGQFSQAAAKYEQTFKGPPPPTFGIEYYMTLAGTDKGWPEARRGLERLAQANPNDNGAKLALAEILTYHADTRPQGIRSLAQLSNDPVVGNQAKQSWKKAVLWLGASAQDKALYNEYLAKFGQDAEVKQHIAEVERPGAAAAGPSGRGAASAGGYADLNRGNVGAAGRQFEATLRHRPGDADALAGLGLVRLREQRFGDARDLLGRAMREAPGRRAQWATAYDTAVFWSTVNAAKSARDSGDLQRARSILSGLVREPRGANWNADLVLGEVDARLGDYAGAEAAYRRVLATHPDNADANVGLYAALTAQGKTVEAAQVSARLATLDPSKMAGVTRARSDVLRNEAKTLQQRGDVYGAQAKFQEAIAVDPGNAWARLDFARFLVARADPGQAFAVVNPAASGNTADAYQAAAVFYSEQNRFDDALAALDQIPARSRNADVTAFRERMLTTVEVGRAKQLARAGNRAQARATLLGLNSRLPATSEKTMLVANALMDIGDPQAALQVAQPKATSNKRALMDYADLLRRGGRDSEATAYIARAEAIDRFSPDEKQNLEHVKGDIAVQRADLLRTRGDIAAAYDQLSPLLNAYPNDPNLLLAAGRIYAAAGRNSEAMSFFDAAYQQAPTDLGIIRGAVGGAISAGDLTRARAYLAQGMQTHPNNPRLYYLQAEIARASGDNGSAVYDLAVARSLNAQQAASSEPLPSQTYIVPAPGSRPLPPNPFRQSEATQPARPIRLAEGPALVASDATPAPRALPGPLQETAVSADSEDLVVPPRAGERPQRPAATAASLRSGSDTRPGMQLAAYAPMSAPVVGDPAVQSWPAPQPGSVSQLPPLPPPPLAGYRPPGYVQQPVQAPLQPFGAAPIQTAPMLAYGAAPPVPQDSLELDIERSLSAIAAESAPTIQAGLGFRGRSGEDGLSALTEITAPIEGTFSPFFTGTARLQAIPTYLTSGTATGNTLLRFGNEALLALPGSGATALLPAGSQTAGGVSLNAAYSYQIFSGEIGTTPLGFPVENLVGRIALTWPGPGANSTALPTIPLAPINVANPLTIKVEGARLPITESILSYAGTRDPVSGQVWGGVVKTGGDALISYDDGLFGAYGGGGFWSIEGKSVANNSEAEALVGAYVRPYRSGANAFKIGINLNYEGFDKNLRFFTFGQGGYFSPQTYLNFSVPMEYSGRNGRYTYLVGGALGVQTYNESRSPVFPTSAANQARLQNAFGNLAFYPSRSVTGFAFNMRGQLEYQLDNGFSVGGLASVDNAHQYTEGIAKVYFRKTFGTSLPAAAYLPNSLPGRL